MSPIGMKEIDFYATSSLCKPLYFGNGKESLFVTGFVYSKYNTYLYMLFSHNVIYDIYLFAWKTQARVFLNETLV